MLSSGDISKLQRRSQTQSERVKNSIHRKADVDKRISDEIDFKITKVTRDNDGHFIMIRGHYIQIQANCGFFS